MTTSSDASILSTVILFSEDDGSSVAATPSSDAAITSVVPDVTSAVFPSVSGSLSEASIVPLDDSTTSLSSFLFVASLDSNDRLFDAVASSDVEVDLDEFVISTDMAPSASVDSTDFSFGSTEVKVVSTASSDAPTLDWNALEALLLFVGSVDMASTLLSIAFSAAVLLADNSASGRTDASAVSSVMFVCFILCDCKTTDICLDLLAP
mmetsp:Transcript_23109/g.33110  ORF Transcript_23109/g.33110 Transcript_23109/m.33110 type:complete len:208 (+) Transcript_23109:977-1600(+)